MRKTLLVSVSTIALIAATGLVGAQEKGMGGGAQAPSGPSQMSPQSGGGAEPKGGGELRGGGAEKGTTGQSSEPRAEPKGGADMKGGEPKGQASEPKAEPKAGTTGQAPKADSKGDREAPKAAPAPRAQESGKDAPTQAPADSKSGTTGQGAAGGAGAQLSTEQRTQISNTVRQVNVRPETNVNFSISVGTVVPRSITLHVLPPRVVEIYPAWRGYRFILVGNDIIVIDPATYRIVAVIAV